MACKGLRDPILVAGTGLTTAPILPHRIAHAWEGDRTQSRQTGEPRMASSEQDRVPTSQQVNDLFDALEYSKTIGTEEFKLFIDHVPIPRGPCLLGT